MTASRTSPLPTAPSGRGMAVHVIHMARSTARRAIMTAEFDGVGLTPTDWAACDASLPQEAARIAALPDTGPWGRLTGHAKGCLLSHLDAMDRFLASDARHALLVEDDVHLADDLGNWADPSDWWPADADVVKFERWRDDRLKVLLDTTGPHHAGRDLRRLRSRHSGTGGYVVSRKGAARILAHRPRNMPIDHLLFNMGASALARSLVTYQVTPALIVQGNDPETQAAVPAPSPRRTRPVATRISRGLAELRILRDLPRLLTGRSRLQSICWQARAIPD